MRIVLILSLLITFFIESKAQISCEPIFPTQTDQVTITFDATQGNAALAGFAGPVFAHMGVITNQSTSPSDWKHVSTTWGINDPVGAMTNAGPNLWKKTITINTFFNLSANETVLQLAFVFRNQSGNVVGRAANGGDIYYNVYPANGPIQLLVIKPTATVTLLNQGGTLPVKAATSKSAIFDLTDNGTSISTSSGTTFDYTATATIAGVHKMELHATAGAESVKSTFYYVVPSPITTQDPPAGSNLGITYTSNQSVRLVLYAPNKQVVHVMGDFNNWLPGTDFQMKRGTDNATWWLDINGLNPGQTYRFQYLVDGTLRIADPLSTLVLDQNNDPYIPSITFPNLPSYPSAETAGAVSLLQPGQQPYNWTATNYQRPKKSDLIIYELLPRDFVNRHDFQTIMDSLDYFEKLGITAIELMPVNEFDGNISWGYNPSYHKALDKYYGSPTAFKAFVDACHQRNIAVILDVVFNHASGSSPLAQLYWDAGLNRPAADNPWLNPTAKHDFNVFNDFNHESPATKAYVKNCLAYWLSEYKVDGFRFDLSKGFTQKNTLNNTAAWGQYDATRIAILNDYANTMWAVDPTSYVMLEHFADNTEEKELSSDGMMLWGNMHGAYKETAIGFNLTGGQTNLSGIDYKNRTWAEPHLIGYMESHDEERIGFECRSYGNSNGNYNIKWLPIATKRSELMHNLLFTVPGPKLLWQFQEVGYDFSINTCENGTINNNCRTSPKPIRWDFYNYDPYRRRLFDVTAALLHLRKSQDVFETSDYQLNISGSNGRTIRLNSPNFNVHVLANVALTSGEVAPNFQHTGTWHEYYTGTAINVTNTTASITLGPGEYRLYTDQFVPLPSGLNPTPIQEVSGPIEGFSIYPNPANSVVWADFSLIESATLLFTVTDVTGRTVMSINMPDLPSGDQRVELDLAQWEPGFYMVSIRDQAGHVMTQKLVIQ